MPRLGVLAGAGAHLRSLTPEQGTDREPRPCHRAPDGHKQRRETTVVVGVCGAQLGLQQHTQPAAGLAHEPSTQNLWGSAPQGTDLPQPHTRWERSKGRVICN